jgi:hypothetical protein
MTDREPRIERVECGICETSFTQGSIVDIAKRVASHWNDEHNDEFHNTQPFKTEEYGGRHLHGDEYAYTVKEYYVTAYDVIDPESESCGPFAYQYVKEPEAVDHCEDCWRSIHTVEGYEEIESDGWRDKYLCTQCKTERTIKRRKKNNQELTEWAE